MPSRRPPFTADVESTLRRAAKAGIRSVAGRDSRIEQRLRRAVGSGRMIERGDGWRQTTTTRSVVIRSTRPSTGESPVAGLYLFGGCDLPALFRMAPMLAPRVVGDLAIHREDAVIYQARADLLEQVADGTDVASVPAIADRLGPVADRLRCSLFDPTFHVDEEGAGEFPKSVVFLTGGGNAMRPLYRHRASGALLDPGILWPEGTPEVDRDTLAWIRGEFDRVGVQGVDEFAVSMRRVVHALRERTGAQLVVLNSLTIEPGVHTHTYAHHRRPQALRRREFHLALTQLSAELGFGLLDVDRALKRGGIAEVVDFAHFPVSAYDAIAAEGVRVLDQLGVT